ncbi:hypothetical protein RKE29_23490, partial [Streptomyces sp. B1866]|nr:hypothetical protein [Streptomyces sp. B1866]
MPWRERTRAWTGGSFVLLLVYLAAAVTLDVATPRAFRLDVYSAVAPMAGAVLCTYRQTVVLGALDFTFMAVAHGALPGDFLLVNRVAAVFGNGLMVITSIVVARLLRDRDDLLDRVRATAEAAQHALLRPLPLHSDDLVVDGFYVAAQREALIGGDIYEVVGTPYGTRVLIGDVQGKGTRTLGAGAAVLTAFREAAYHRRSLVGGVKAMEQGLARYNAGQAVDGGGERFVTALVFGLETPEQRAARPDTPDGPADGRQPRGGPGEPEAGPAGTA